MDALIPGWVFTLAWPPLFLISVVFFGGAIERHLIAPDPEPFAHAPQKKSTGGSLEGAPPAVTSTPAKRGKP